MRRRPINRVRRRMRQVWRRYANPRKAISKLRGLVAGSEVQAQ
jgi:hypothetical protein